MMLQNFVSRVRKWNRERLEIHRRRPTTLGVLAIMKNEAMNIDEWIEHYLWMGASKIYLIDNGSTDDTVAKARAWEKTGHVKLVEYSGKHLQRQHYWRAFRHFRIARQCEWLLIADLDEFWFCPNGKSLVETLRDYSGYDVIYSHWAMFGSSDLTTHPQSIRKTLTLRRHGVSGPNLSKYICRTRVVKNAMSLHIHKLKGADSSRTTTENQGFQLNHYAIQSLQYFQTVKMTRGDVAHSKYDTFRDMDYFHKYDEGCDQVDMRLADLVAASKVADVQSRHPVDRIKDETIGL